MKNRDLKETRNPAKYDNKYEDDILEDFSKDEFRGKRNNKKTKKDYDRKEKAIDNWN